MDGKQIFTAIPEAIKLIESVGKNHENEKQKWKFRSIDDVYNAVNKAIKEVGITICPNYEIVTDKTEEVKNSYGKLTMQHNLVLRGNYRLYAKDGSYIETNTFGKKLDYGDKGFNAAMSSAYKYMLFQVFCIPTEEEAKNEPDKEAPEISKPTKPNKQKEEPTPEKEPTYEKNTINKHKAQIDFIYKMIKTKGIEPVFLDEEVKRMTNQNNINKMSEEQLKELYEIIKGL